MQLYVLYDAVHNHILGAVRMTRERAALANRASGWFIWLLAGSV